MTASEHNTESDSLEHCIYPPKSERDYRETTTRAEIR